MSFYSSVPISTTMDDLEPLQRNV